MPHSLLILTAQFASTDSGSARHAQGTNQSASTWNQLVSGLASFAKSSPLTCAINVPYASIPYELNRFFSIPTCERFRAGLGCGKQLKIGSLSRNREHLL